MNVTYLLGAGASFEALPIVNKIPGRLEVFASQFKLSSLNYLLLHKQKSNIAEKYLLNINSPKIQEEKFNTIKQFHGDILWLKNESEKHTSIDTFAKKLYLQGGNDLKKLKYILSCFFLYEQTLNFDKRYDSFFASILDDLSKIPNELKVISWNYDSQLEIAFNNFANSNIKNTRKTLNIFSKGNKNETNKRNNEFSIFKVNGTTNVTDKDNEVYDLILDFDIKEENLITSFLELYESKILFDNHKPNMSFAWENFNSNSNFYNDLANSAKNTDVLIVIGYSFPFFNRKIDKFILDSMPKLKKIYVQDPNNADDIIEKIKGLKPWQTTQITIKSPPGLKATTKDIIEFIPKTFTDQFYIPIEF
ncbi:hypothetical protein [Winogradskyella ludwigii]|jgi:hypothetical protein|uniref:hypothetical protein n=1 Tax=Winogradskyella ludwigii TaxID=2686076 RepID=UPI0015CB9F0C|nr:hypothetical protein [Winogradskyella ludwigii]